MYGFVLTIHIIVSVGLILIVLLQAGKGAGISGLFGGGSNDSAFSGATTPGVIKKITTTMAVLFMITSLALTVIIAKSRRRSLAETIPVAQPTQQQQQPAPSPSGPDAVPPAQE
ncbi:MAG: preprotein translocase subunit SecG [Elusimicrobia bacterium]|nr:preprotein translocase subunit SecG [Elusimicrobiota bacterium]